MSSLSLINLFLLNIFISYANGGLCIQSTIPPPITTKNIIKTTFFITITIPCPKGTVFGRVGGCLELTTLDHFKIETQTTN